MPSWTKDANVGAATGAVKTPMPGKLVKLLVNEGQVGAGVRGQLGGMELACEVRWALVAPRRFAALPWLYAAPPALHAFNPFSTRTL